MKTLKQLLNFYINSSIHVALAVYALTWITLLELGLHYDEAVLYFVFYASITGYNFVKYFGLVKFHHRKLANWLKLIQVLSFICFVLMCFYGYQLQERTLLIIGICAVLTFFYAIPFFKKKAHTLRSIEGLKVFVIALVWTSATVLIPAINEEYSNNKNAVLLTIQRFIYVLVLMIPFEIRDLKFDNLALKTVPQKLGVKGTKILGIILLMVFLILEVLKDNWGVVNMVRLITITGITGMLVFFSKTDQSKYYSSFWVEGLPVVWLLLWLIFS
ncbi:hypothetical protein [Algibacter mikhailovii]|uniref:hypothetical protein n=1 Tax=Algibacter mikhailovii TaxID=425498 RepID=UPI00249479AB|nr:hypothetical protein [Algibacter mikhailovii]